MAKKKFVSVTLENSRFVSSSSSREFFDLVHKSLEGRNSPVARLPSSRNDEPELELQVVSAFGADESMLLRLDTESRLKLLSRFPALDIQDDATAQMAIFQPEILPDHAAMAGGVAATRVDIVVEDPQGNAIEDADIEAIVEFGPPMVGAVGKSDGNGKFSFLTVRQPLYILAKPRHSHWPCSLMEPQLVVGQALRMKCRPLQDHGRDVVNHYYDARIAGNADKQGIVVAIIDGGAGPHDELTPAFHPASKNLVRGENENDWHDNGLGHGTHVAGIVRRLAPACQLLIIRAYAAGSPKTNAFTVAHAIREAVEAGAHIINLSLTLDNEQPAVREQIQRALARGVVCVAAAGNDAGVVRAPAKYSEVLAVSASGRAGTFPQLSLEPYLGHKGTTQDGELRAAVFTCFGNEVAVSAPGVGIVSLFHDQRRAVMSGTSMATPVVTALLARAMAADPAFAGRGADVDRAEQMRRVVYSQARRMGFDPAAAEGHGLAFST